MGKYTHMHPIEVQHALRWYREDGMALGLIAKLLKRCPKTVRNNLKGKPKGACVGRPPMSDKDYARCDKALTYLQQRANAHREVTAAMVKERAGVPHCERTIRDAFRAHGKPFRKLREKPLLTPEDVAQRLIFARKHAARPRSAWVTCPHAVIDNKRFSMPLDRRAREHEARRAVRGAYRAGSSAVESHLVKPKAHIKYPMPGVQVTAAVVKGRVRFWHVTEGRWNAARAVEMYAALAKTLAKAYPERAAKPRARWTVLEDNDPAGYKASAAQAKKAELGISTMSLPPRSPDLNVLDYSIWSEINRRLRQQEARFRSSRKESKVRFLKRLRRVALTLPASFVTKAVQSMKRRCKSIEANKGYLIEE